MYTFQVSKTNYQAVPCSPAYAVIGLYTLRMELKFTGFLLDDDDVWSTLSTLMVIFLPCTPLMCMPCCFVLLKCARPS